METKRENIAVPISVAGVIVIVFRFILSILSRTLLVPLAVNLEGFGIALYTIILNVLVFLVVLGSIMIANRVANKKTNIRCSNCSFHSSCICRFYLV